MDEVLSGIKSILESEVLTVFYTENDEHKQYLKSVNIWDHRQAATMVSQANCPGFYLTPLGEPVEEIGPMANMKTRKFNVNIRLYNYSSDPSKLRSWDNANSGYKIMESARTALSGRKNIASQGSGYTPYYLSLAQPQIDKSDDKYIVFDLQIQYYRFETWFGDANNQDGIKLEIQESNIPDFVFN